MIDSKRIRISAYPQIFVGTGPPHFCGHRAASNPQV